MAQKRRSMKKPKAHRISRKLLQSLDLPEEITKGTPKCTLLGRENLLVENHGGVLQYDKGIIRLYTQIGILAITGDDLTLLELGRERAYVTGHVRAVAYEK